MLEKLLEIIHEEGTVTPALLARRLNTSPAMVAAMLADLERRGLLREMDAGTTCQEQSCRGCPLGGSCKPLGIRLKGFSPPAPRSLTEKK